MTTEERLQFVENILKDCIKYRADASGLFEKIGYKYTNKNNKLQKLVFTLYCDLCEIEDLCKYYFELCEEAKNDK